MKPSSGTALPFLTSALEPQRQARGCECRVQGGGECDALGAQKKITVGPQVDCYVWFVNFYP
eukprot:1867076-Prymnesium_polylepis.1